MKDTLLKKYSGYFFIIIFLLIAYLSFLVVKPFGIAVFSSFILAYIFYPVYKKLLIILKNKNITSLFLIILITLIILIPMFFIVNSLFQESLSFYSYVKNLDLSYINNIYNINFNNYVSDIIETGTKFFVNLVKTFIISIPGKILQGFVILFLMFYLFKDGERITRRIEYLIPLNKKYKDRFLKETKEISHAVIYGLLISGLIQGILGGLIFWILGIPNPILWGFVMMFLSILPIVGPPLIWAPVAIYFLINGNNVGGIVLLIYGVGMSVLDMILRPKIIGDKAKIHPVIILLGILGGIKLFGIVGIILGPLFLSFLITFLKLHKGVKSGAES